MNTPIKNIYESAMMFDLRTQSMRLLKVLFVCAFLTGCASFKSEVLPIENPTVTVMLQNNVEFDNPRTKGDAGWWYVGKQKYCLIRLREYPYYIGHEMRHCFEGYWHDESPNGEDY